MIDDDVALVDRYGEGPERASLQAAATGAREEYQKLTEMLTADLAPRGVEEEAFIGNRVHDLCASRAYRLVGGVDVIDLHAEVRVYGGRRIFGDENDLGGGVGR